LHTSQPSLSRQIRDLEDEVGAELFSRSARGVELTAAGRAFLDHARLALTQVDAATEAARRAAQPSKQVFALGFLTGQEMTWLPRAMQVLRDELPNIDVTVSSHYSPDLADALARGKLDLAFLRAEPGFDLDYRVVSREKLIALMPSDHPLTARAAVRAEDFKGEPFIMASNKAKVLHDVIKGYLKRSGVDVTPEHGVDNLAMAMSLVASTRGLALLPEYANNLLPWSVVSRPLEGEAPTIDLVIGYSRSNTSPVLKLFLSRANELMGHVDAARVRGIELLFQREPVGRGSQEHGEGLVRVLPTR
jgi:LysR family hca operon transcriptional activator